MKMAVMDHNKFQSNVQCHRSCNNNYQSYEIKAQEIIFTLKYLYFTGILIKSNKSKIFIEKGPS